ncbi:MAG: 2-hydroxyacyl-CoA dehydratase family protein [Thermodesulfobacteriota bacterium]|nr:2-hydroxyacyl-CoA dehydratase family protein [Thermodesulfobacteriota bacterium]
MREEISETTTTLFNRYVKKRKDGGGKVVGYTCTYVPEEIIYAAGMLPFRLRGIEATSTSIGDIYYGPVICSFPKCVLQLAGEGKYKFLDGAVICNGCDSMRRLDECWRKASEDYEGILPSWFYYYGVPHKVADYSLKWFVEETKKLICSLEEYFGVKITDDDLKKAISVYNKGRTLLKRLDELRMADEPPISGADALAVIIAGTAIPRDEYNKLLEELLDELGKSKERIAGKKRLLLGGSVNDDVSLVGLIEEAGAIVVADTLCFGSRSYVDLIEEDGDPLVAICKRYLTHSFCPRMFGYYKERFRFLKERAEKAKVDGVILQNIRFCDLHGSENGIFERDLEANGIPCMRMEREYGPLVETGRIKMRMDAFLERIS